MGIYKEIINLFKKDTSPTVGYLVDKFFAEKEIYSDNRS